MGLIRRTIDLLANQRDAAMAAPSRQALRMAIWSNKQAISPDEITKLKPLWGRYFEQGV